MRTTGRERRNPNGIFLDTGNFSTPGSRLSGLHIERVSREWDAHSREAASENIRGDGGETGEPAETTPERSPWTSGGVNTLSRMSSRLTGVLADRDSSAVPIDGMPSVFVLRTEVAEYPS